MSSSEGVHLRFLAFAPKHSSFDPTVNMNGALRVMNLSKRLVAFSAAGALTLAACADDDDDTASTAPVTSADAATDGSAATTAAPAATGETAPQPSTDLSSLGGEIFVTGSST